MFKFLRKTDIICSPVKGHCIPLEEVNDNVFASKMMGDGFAVRPTENVIASPVNGTIIMIPETKHAFGIKSDAGTEILVHVGLDTVNLKGEGFDILAHVGDKVNCNTPIIMFHEAFMKSKQMDMVTMVILTSDHNNHLPKQYPKEVERGEVLIK